MTRFVDYHTHLDLYPEHQSLLLAAKKSGHAIFTMTTTPLAWERNFQMAQQCPNVRVGLGLHPQLVAQRAEEIGLFEKLVCRTKFVGEVGLDAGPRFYKSLALQEAVFERILIASKNSGPKIVSLHSVRSASKVMDLIERVQSTNLKFVFHWFTGSKSEAKRAIEMGSYFSVNRTMMGTERGRGFVEGLPIDRILTETDGPFIVDSNGAPIQPGDVTDVVLSLSHLLKKPSDLVIEIICKNLSKLEGSL
jgi:TatD DNase family protein